MRTIFCPILQFLSRLMIAFAVFLIILSLVCGTIGLLLRVASGVVPTLPAQAATVATVLLGVALGCLAAAAALALLLLLLGLVMRFVCDMPFKLFSEKGTFGCGCSNPCMPLCFPPVIPMPFPAPFPFTIPFPYPPQPPPSPSFDWGKILECLQSGKNPAECFGQAGEPGTWTGEPPFPDAPPILGDILRRMRGVQRLIDIARDKAERDIRDLDAAAGTANEETKGRIGEVRNRVQQTKGALDSLGQTASQAAGQVLSHVPAAPPVNPPRNPFG